MIENRILAFNEGEYKKHRFFFPGLVVFPFIQLLNFLNFSRHKTNDKQYQINFENV